MNSVESHYFNLFRGIEQQLGAVSDVSTMGIVGFSAGGPVSVCRVADKAMYVTCELSLYEEQIPSSEGLRFELLCACDLSQDDSQSLLTALGGLSMHAELGHLHIVNVSNVTPDSAIQNVQLQLLSQCMHAGKAFGVYSVVPSEVGT